MLTSQKVSKELVFKEKSEVSVPTSKYEVLIGNDKLMRAFGVNETQNPSVRPFHSRYVYRVSL